MHERRKLQSCLWFAAEPYVFHTDTPPVCHTWAASIAPCAGMGGGDARCPLDPSSEWIRHRKDGGSMRLVADVHPKASVPASLGDFLGVADFENDRKRVRLRHFEQRGVDEEP